MCIKVVQTTKLISFLNLCNFCTYQFLLQFSLFENIVAVSVDNSSIFIKKHTHLCLRQPYGFIL